MCGWRWGNCGPGLPASGVTAGVPRCRRLWVKDLARATVGRRAMEGCGASLALCLMIYKMPLRMKHRSNNHLCAPPSSTVQSVSI